MVSKKKKRKTTIDDLAMSMENGFKMADEKIEKGFKTVDNRFKAFDEKIEKGFKTVDNRFKAFDEKMEKGFKTVDNRFKTFDEKMEKGFKRADERLEITVNNLATMIGKGFNEMDKKIENLRKENEREHEEIKLSLNNVAYRFELIELQKRVEILERRIKTV